MNIIGSIEYYRILYRQIQFIGPCATVFTPNLNVSNRYHPYTKYVLIPDSSTE